jgi:hypothetical protein
VPFSHLLVGIQTKMSFLGIPRASHFATRLVFLGEGLGFRLRTEELKATGQKGADRRPMRRLSRDGQPWGGVCLANGGSNLREIRVAMLGRKEMGIEERTWPGQKGCVEKRGKLDDTNGIDTKALLTRVVLQLKGTTACENGPVAQRAPGCVLLAFLLSENTAHCVV